MKMEWIYYFSHPGQKGHINLIPEGKVIARFIVLCTMESPKPIRDLLWWFHYIKWRFYASFSVIYLVYKCSCGEAIRRDQFDKHLRCSRNILPALTNIYSKGKRRIAVKWVLLHTWKVGMLESTMPFSVNTSSLMKKPHRLLRKTCWSLELPLIRLPPSFSEMNSALPAGSPQRLRLLGLLPSWWRHDLC